MKNIEPISISGSDTRVKFTLDDNTVVTQIIANVPVNDAEAARQFLTDYGAALERGIEVAKQTATPLVPAPGLMGVKFDVASE